MTRIAWREDDDALLVAYVDGGLDPARTLDVERMLDSDPRARERVAVFRETAAQLRSACAESFYAEPALPRVAPPLAALAVPRRRRVMALAASVALVAGGFGAGAVWRAAAEGDALVEIAEYHSVFAAASPQAVELPAERVGEMAAWVGEANGTALAVPDLGRASLRLLGGRRLLIDGARVAELVYARPNGPPIGLCVQLDSRAPAAVRVDQRDGLHLASWRDGSRRYVIVGDLNPAASRDLARLVAAQHSG